MTPTAAPVQVNEPELKPTQAILLYAASEGDSNMLYAAGFFVPDPFIFFQHKKLSYVVMSDLEIDRAKKQAKADRVLSLSLYQRKLRKLGKSPAGVIDILDLLFPRTRHSLADRAGEFLRLARRSAESQRLQRANQARSVLAETRNQKQAGSETDHRIPARSRAWVSKPASACSSAPRLSATAIFISTARG